MKQILFSLLFTSFACTLFAQFQDDFSDGDFTNNPTWEGNVDHFIVNQNNTLQLNAPEAGNSNLFTSVNIPDSAVWEITVGMDFSPSKSNRLQVFLQSSISDLENGSGYFLEIGEDGNGDAIHLFRKDVGANTLLASGAAGAFATGPINAKLKVTRNVSGDWNIFTNYDNGLVFTLEATASDGTYSGGNVFFGISCFYTSTRKDKFDFDNINIAPLQPDVSPPVLVAVTALSFNELEVEFDEILDMVTGSFSMNYVINGGIGNPQNAEVDMIEPNKVFLALSNTLINNQTYTLTVENVKDEFGNTMLEESLDFTFFIPELIEPGDLVINEILFNPTTGGSDFVEIYNRSNKYLDISDLIIANTQRTSGATKDIETAHILSPGEYAAFTPDKTFILNEYSVQNPNALFENSLPGYNDSEGNVSIFTSYFSDTVMIDSFDYSDDFHYALLSNTEGISLERISFDAPTQGQSNWHSASTVVGGATPTFTNSQFRMTAAGSEIFNIADPVFSPDNDGFEDFLLINYSLENPGYLATLNIYDARGRLVKKLIENELLGLQGNFKWDGLTAEGIKARIGIYVVTAEIFTPEKKAEYFKKTCVVAGKLD